MFRWAPLLHHWRSYLQCSVRYRTWRQHAGDILQLLFPLRFLWWQQLQTLFHQTGFRLIIQTKKSHRCSHKGISTQDHSQPQTIHHSHFITRNIKFILHREWVLKFHPISSPFKPLKYLLNGLELGSTLSTCMRGEIQPKVVFEEGKEFSRRPEGCAWCSLRGKRAAGATQSRTVREREGM